LSFTRSFGCPRVLYVVSDPPYQQSEKYNQLRVLSYTFPIILHGSRKINSSQRVTTHETGRQDDRKCIGILYTVSAKTAQVPILLRTACMAGMVTLRTENSMARVTLNVLLWQNIGCRHSIGIIARATS
jgi:hypothetical protein